MSHKLMLVLRCHANHRQITSQQLSLAIGFEAGFAASRIIGLWVHLLLIHNLAASKYVQHRLRILPAA